MKNDSSILKAINLYSSAGQRPRSAKTDRLKTTPSFNKLNKQQNQALNDSYNNFNKFSNMLPKTLPIQIEKEQYYVENLSLKAEIQRLQSDLSKLKSHQKLHDVELQKRDRELNDLFKSSVAGKHAEDFIGKESYLKNLNYSQLYRKFKEKYKQLKTVLIEKDKEIETLKTQIKFTKINEYVIQNKLLMDEIEKYKNLLKKNEEMTSFQMQNADNKLLENVGIIKNEENNRISLETKIRDLETKNAFLIEQNIILNQQILQLHTSSNTNNTSLKNLFSNQIFLDIVNFNFYLEGNSKEASSSGFVVLNTPNNINKRIINLTKENQNLAIELKKIDSISKDLKSNNQNKALKMNELNHTEKECERSSRTNYSLREIERFYIEDVKFIKTIYLIIKAIFQCYNICIEVFMRFLKLDQHQKKMSNKELYTSLLKYFLKLQIVSDFEDLFSVHILCISLIREYENTGFNDFQNHIKKNLFIEEEKKDIEQYISKLFESKETFLSNRDNSLYKFIEETSVDIIKLKTFKKFITLTSIRLHRDQFYSMIYLMKLYNPDNKFLGFYDINIKIFKEIISQHDKIYLRNQIDSIHNLTSSEEESILNLIYSPNINLNFTDILSIFNDYNDYPIPSLFKKLKDYLFLKGLNLSNENEPILFKAIKTGKLYDKVKQFRKDILIVKKKSNLELYDSVDDMLFAEVIVNGSSKPSGPQLKPKPTSEIVMNDFPELSETSMLSEYNLSRIMEIKKTNNGVESNNIEKNNIIDDIPEDI